MISRLLILRYQWLVITFNVFKKLKIMQACTSNNYDGFLSVQGNHGTHRKTVLYVIKYIMSILLLILLF